MTKKIAIYGLFFLFILIHELTHVIVGILLGQNLKEFTVIPFGFKIEFQENKEKKIVKNIIIAIAGPAINLILMIIATIFKWDTTIIYSNLIIVFFNLLPIYPLDGGRIIKSILEIKFKESKVYYILNKVSNISIIFITMLSSIMVLYIKNICILFVILYLWYIVAKENKRYKIIKRVYQLIQND